MKDPSFLGDLKTIQHIKYEYIRLFFEIENIFTSTLDYLETYYPNSVEMIDFMELIGSGSPNNNWAIGVQMQMVEDGVFEIETNLQDGFIKIEWTGLN